MVNVVFMESHSVLIEIKTLAIVEPVFYAFAVSSGQQYNVFVCDELDEL